jgi:hypothetical protein
MYSFKRSVVTLFGLLALIGAVAAITPFKGYGQQSPEAVAATQDVRVVNTTANPALTRNIDAPRGNNIVTLYSSSVAQTAATFKRVFADGSIAGSAFVVPAGQVLIVTDLSWRATCDDCLANTVELSLFIYSGNTQLNRVYYTFVELGSDDQAMANENMRTGFTVGAGRSVRASHSIGNVAFMFLHGYLVPAS